MKKAVLPVMAAIGGMVVPAMVFLLFNVGNPDYSAGWGIPMATDIAFALGILAGLVLGEFIGISVFSHLIIKLKLAVLGVFILLGGKDKGKQTL